MILEWFVFAVFFYGAYALIRDVLRNISKSNIPSSGSDLGVIREEPQLELEPLKKAQAKKRTRKAAPKKVAQKSPAAEALGPQCPIDDPDLESMYRF